MKLLLTVVSTLVNGFTPWNFGSAMKLILFVSNPGNHVKKKLYSSAAVRT